MATCSPCPALLHNCWHRLYFGDRGGVSISLLHPCTPRYQNTAELFQAYAHTGQPILCESKCESIQHPCWAVSSLLTWFFQYDLPSCLESDDALTCCTSKNVSSRRFPSLVQAPSGMSLMHYPIFHPARSTISYLFTSVSSSSTMLQGQGAEEGQHGAWISNAHKAYSLKPK